ncbi:MAG: hypothetical protein IJ422_03745 [Oscillospiraceae bacterium]|nr:hypothetical protein [Oscillospiraceae bacterium]
MKKVVALLLMLMLCISLACPAFAAENDFVPSITYKGEPEIVPTEDDKGEPVIGVVRKEKEIKSYIHDGCLLITPVAKAETSTAIPDEAAETLLYVYEELASGRMKLPYEKAAGYNGEDMVIRELLDVSWLCGTDTSDHDHPTEVRPEGIVFDVTFDLGVKASDKVIVMSYHDGQWAPIVAVVNNGDGTVTCTFEHLCPVAISVDQARNVPDTGDTSHVMVWMLVMLLSLVALLALVVVYFKKQAKR